MTLRSCVLAAAATALGGCLLDPLVDDHPAASVHVLPPGSEVPGVDADPELVHQITVHDGLDDGDLEEAGGVVAREDGWAGGEPVRYWSFGTAPRIGAPVYVLVEITDGGPRPVGHPYLFDTLPGDPGYSPIRRIQHVPVTPEYGGELITTVRALADAIDLGLVEEPINAATWMNAPVVPPGTRLEVGDGATAEPIEVFAVGYRASAFVLGGERGVQPLRNGQVPVAQASTLQEARSVRPQSEPIFQLGIPAEPPGEDHNYTPIVQIVAVQLADGVVAADQIHDDADLFERSERGDISGIAAAVDSFEITDTVRNWPVQFTEGEP
jgi:hypothetical protein